MPRLRAVAVACSTVLVAGLLTALPATQATANPVDPPTPRIEQRYLDQPINWSPCPFDAAVKNLYPAAPTTNCATVKVPMDWNNPDPAKDIDIAISHSKATKSSRGLMLTNPGGPGGAGLSLTASLATEKPQLFTDYDLAGLDPRGFGRSTPLRCLTTAGELEQLPTTPDRRERTDQTRAAELAEAKLVAKACASTEYAKFVSSQQTVYDMDFVRALLGSEKLNFIGYSYGTWLGGWYGDTYPQRVDRFVLDSSMDWTRTQWENIQFDPFSGQRRRDAQLFPWIARQAAAGEIQGLATNQAELTEQYDQLRVQLTDLVKQRSSKMRGDTLDGRLYSAMYSNNRFIRASLDIMIHQEFAADYPSSGLVEARHVERAWARLSPALQAFDTLTAMKARYNIAADAASSVPSDLAAATQVTQVFDVVEQARTAAAAKKLDQSEEVNLGAISTTVRCNDTAWRGSANFYQLEADRKARRYPFFGYMNGMPMCAFWPFAPQDRRLDLPDSPTMLHVQAEFDPATAWEGAWRTRQAVGAAARFVGIDDEGQHGQYILGPGVACVQSIGDAFVFNGTLPSEDQMCDTNPLPNESKVYAVDGPADGKSVRLPERRTQVQSAPEHQLNPLLQHNLDLIAAAQR